MAHTGGSLHLQTVPAKRETSESQRGARLGSSRMCAVHSHRQFGIIIHLHNAEQKVLWDQHKGAEAVIPAVPHKAIPPLRQVLHRLVREGTPEMQSGTCCHPGRVASSGAVTAQNIHCLTVVACHPYHQPRKSHCSEKAWC